MGELQKRINRLCPTKHGIYILPQITNAIFGNINNIIDQMVTELKYLEENDLGFDVSNSVREWLDRWLFDES